MRGDPWWNISWTTMIYKGSRRQRPPPSSSLLPFSLFFSLFSFPLFLSIYHGKDLFVSPLTISLTSHWLKSLQHPQTPIHLPTILWLPRHWIWVMRNKNQHILTNIKTEKTPKYLWVRGVHPLRYCRGKCGNSSHSGNSVIYVLFFDHQDTESE